MISIIDDDHSVLVATELLVSSFGFQTSIFSSAEGFLQSDRINDTECLISDIHMPTISGIELQGILRARGRKIPMILMTAFSTDNVRARAMAGGAVCFLIKPFEAQTLLGCVNAALKR